MAAHTPSSHRHPSRRPYQRLKALGYGLGLGLLIHGSACSNASSTSPPDAQGEPDTMAQPDGVDTHVMADTAVLDTPGDTQDPTVLEELGDTEPSDASSLDSDDLQDGSPPDDGGDQDVPVLADGEPLDDTTSSPHDAADTTDSHDLATHPDDIEMDTEPPPLIRFDFLLPLMLDLLDDTETL